MNTTIFGAGNMGRAIGTRFAAGGHSVTFVDPNPEEAQRVAREVQSAARKGATVATAGPAEVELGDVVVLAVWYGANLNLVKELGPRLAGKVVVDIANPLNATFDGLATAPDSSSAEDVARIAPAGARGVKAFNTTFAGTLVSGQVADTPLDVFIAGDDAEAKAKVSRLVTDGGLRAIDAGPLRRAREIEGMQLLHILLQGSLGTNWASALRIVA